MKYVIPKPKKKFFFSSTYKNVKPKRNCKTNRNKNKNRKNSNRNRKNREKTEIERIKRETEEIILQILNKQHIKKLAKHENNELRKESKKFILNAAINISNGKILKYSLALSTSKMK